MLIVICRLRPVFSDWLFCPDGLFTDVKWGVQVPHWLCCCHSFSFYVYWQLPYTLRRSYVGLLCLLGLITWFQIYLTAVRPGIRPWGRDREQACCGVLRSERAPVWARAGRAGGNFIEMETRKPKGYITMCKRSFFPLFKTTLCHEDNFGGSGLQKTLPDNKQ